MKTSNQVKFSLVAAAVMTASATYAYIQNQSLSEQLSGINEQCELKAAALIQQENPKTTLSINTRIKTETAPAPPSQKELKTKRPQAQEVKEHLKDQPKLQKFTESLDDIIKRKYRFLLSGLELSPAELEQLMQLLKKREKLSLELTDAKEFGEDLGLSSSDIADIQYQIALVDEEIQQILEAEQAERYALLKDSDNEQKEFSQYTLGITSLFPLKPDQQEQILFSKLRFKQQFESALQDAGFNMDYPLNAEQQAELISTLQQHADSYMKGFLEEVKPHVDHSNFPMDQYTLLENYTKTEFEQMLAKLKSQVEARGSY